MSEFDDEYYMSGGEGEEGDIDDVDDEGEDDDEVIVKKNLDDEEDEDDDDQEDDEFDEQSIETGQEDDEEEDEDDDINDPDDGENNLAAAVAQAQEGDDGETSDMDTDDESSDEENYTKVDDEFKYNFMKSIHPQEFDDDYNSMQIFTEINRDKDNIIVDKYHQTLPILTKYEKARILGLRISQLNKGAQPFIKFTNSERNVIDTHIIAEKELREKRLPFIIMRPIPNGKKEYWSLQDLEIIDN